MRLYLDKIAVWKKTPVNKITCRPMPKGIRYYEGEDVKLLESKGYRYAKNYNKFCLIVFTLESDMKKVEKLLDKAAKSVKAPKTIEELTYLEEL